MAKITASAPILLVKDVTESANWYRDKLGFDIVNVYGVPAAFAILQRDGHYLMLADADEKDIIPHWKLRDKTSNVYFWVDDVETLYKEFIASGAKIDYSLYTAPYGVKEFGVSDPDEYDVSFGEVVK